MHEVRRPPQESAAVISTPEDLLTPHVDRLESLLRDEEALHDELSALLSRKREAIRTADGRALDEALRLEGACLLKIGECEAKRAEITHAIGSVIVPLSADGSGQLTLREIARHLSSDRSARLVETADRIRRKVEAIRREGSVIRAAAESLGSHIAGVLGVVRSALSNSRIYERRGRLVAGAQVMSTVDVVS